MLLRELRFPLRIAEQNEPIQSGKFGSEPDRPVIIVETLYTFLSPAMGATSEMRTEAIADRIRYMEHIFQDQDICALIPRAPLHHQLDGADSDDASLG